MKVGDLAGIQVFKYKHNAQLYLLAYQHVEGELVLTLIDHGTHENFYRDLRYWQINLFLLEMWKL